MTTPAIRIGGVCRRFGPHVVLRGLDLEVAWGEAVALVGANGAGKTTLLRILTGSLTAQEGRIELAGARPRTHAARSRVVLLMGDAYLYGDLTARENVHFVRQMRGLPGDSDAVESALREVGLIQTADRRARFFSSGMRKRLALARVLALDPSILLLDEPYASLDEDACELIDRLIAGWRRPGRAVVLATHLRNRVRETCDRVLELRDGRLTPEARESIGERLAVAGVAT